MKIYPLLAEAQHPAVRSFKSTIFYSHTTAPQTPVNHMMPTVHLLLFLGVSTFSSSHYSMYFGFITLPSFAWGLRMPFRAETSICVQSHVRDLTQLRAGARHRYIIPRKELGLLSASGIIPGI